MTLKQLERQDRPREKLAKYGPDKLKDSELLALILGSGTKGIDVLELSRKILTRYRNKEIGSASIKDLTEIKGLGTAKASEIVACFELGRRFLNGKSASIILSPEDVWNRMADIRESKKEHFIVFYLDSRNQEIKREIVSMGTLNESLVHPREVFEQAIKNNAASVILAHNHPSGNVESSQDDIDMTKKLIKAGKLLGIEVTDHVIVAKACWKSILDSIYD